MNKVFKYVFIILIFVVVIIFGINCYVIYSSYDRVITDSDYSSLEDIDCILILGAAVRWGEPTPMLEDRLLKGIDLYKNGVASKIVMSGDHGTAEYDEVNIMKNYAIENGVVSSDVFMDHAGFSTYESIYRVKAIFKADKILIVTQKYHLYRALYIADELGIDAYGVKADSGQYVGRVYRELREMLARVKDFVKCLFKVKPTYLGETIPVSGNGDLTDDK